MATIRNTIELQDKMSASLKNINRELKNTEKLMKNLNDVIDNQFEEQAKSVKNLKNELNKLNKDLGITEQKSKQVKNSFDQMNDSLDIFRGTLLGNIAADIFTSVINGLKNTATAAVNYASDLTEVQNVVDTTFGSNAQKINEWSRTSLDSFGLNELSAKNYSSTLGAMMKSAGLTQEQILQMSMGLTQLTGDIASFRNLKPDEAFYKLQSVITGETEPMKQLGVVMTEVNLDAYAMSKGIQTSYREMTNAEKIALRYNYVMESLQDAQGDFAKTSGSFANQSKLLTENWNAFAGQIASYVIPVLTLLLQGLNMIVSFLSDNSEVVIIVLSTLALILSLVAAKALMAGAASMIAGIQAAIAWLGVLWPIILIIAFIGVLLIVLNAFGISATQVISSIAALFVGFVMTVFNLFSMLNNVIIAFVNFLANVFTSPIAAIKMLFYDMAITIVGFIKDVAKSIENLLNAIPFVEVNITSSINGVYNTLKKNKSKLKKESDLKQVMEPIKYQDSSEMASQTYTGVSSSLGNLGNIMSGIGDISSMVGGMGDLYSGLDSMGMENIGGNGIGSLGDSNIIDKVGSVGKIEDDVSITDEDIELLKDVAKLDYVNKFTTMNPEINVSFGDVHETADVNKITQVISEMVKESIATSLV